MADNSPTRTYRKQQGMAPVTQSYDPTVVGWIRQAATRTGADPAALLATSIQESGARRGAVGDAGTSFGPFQFHRGGALGTHSPQWANTYAAVLNRAQEFSRLGVHGGVGAAAVQRPADRSLYATGVQSHLDQARAILGSKAAKSLGIGAPPAGKTPTPKSRVGNDSDPTGDALLAQLVSSQPGGTGAANPFQDFLNANSRLVGIQAPTFLGRPNIPVAQTPAITPQTVTPKAKTPALKPSGRVIAGKAKIIGTPYHGTHTVGNWESDNAVDIAMPIGTPIRAPYSGVIGSQIGSLGSNNPRFAGLRVHLKGAGNELYMAHLSRLAVTAGQKVKAGQIIGYSGEANGTAHLHLGALKGNPGRYA